jgi:YHS domain-containing protein
MTYRIETTDPITGKKLDHLMDMPYVIEDMDDDDLVIYFESEQNKEKYLEDPTEHKLAHYQG